MKNKPLAALYEQGLLSEAQEDQLLNVAFQLLERERIKKIMRAEAKTLQLRRMMMAVIGILGIIGLIWVGKRYFQPKPIIEIIAFTPKSVWQQELNAPLPESGLLGEPKPAEKQLPEAFIEAYNAHDFVNALKIASQQPDFQQDVVLQFYTGFAQFKLGQFDEALKTFDAIEKRNHGYKEAEIRWWRGLIYALQGNTEKADVMFRKIQPYQVGYEKAQKWLENK
ncbi:MAG: hypothetical protein RL329_4222 [Bacteroidota bacterium]|jgi:tetratricopeptide (TPR) repeat protein